MTEMPMTSLKIDDAFLDQVVSSAAAEGDVIERLQRLSDVAKRELLSGDQDEKRRAASQLMDLYFVGAAGVHPPGARVAVERTRLVEPIPVEMGAPVDQVGTTAEDVVAVATSPDADTERRGAALGQWMAMDRDASSQFIARELGLADLSADWRDALVYAAENAHFPGHEEQQNACARLRQLARELRNEQRPGIERVVWSAMRRFASLMRREDVHCLGEFLNREGAVDTRQVALQCIARVFETSPPPDPQRLDALAKRVDDFAEKFLDPDVFAGGENSAIARSAVVALAALGSPRIERHLEQVRSMGRRWFSSRVRTQLREIYDHWTRTGTSPSSNSAVDLLDRCIKRMES